MNSGDSAQKIKVSDYIVDFLYDQGVRQVFELSGGMITHLLDSLHQDGRIRSISVHHEQAGAIAADAVGRITRVPGVALATSGPGATNLLTGIASFYFDSSPGVIITGQVNRDERRGSRPIRQLGFQECDIVDMARPVTKAAREIVSPREIPSALREAFALSLDGRPGPVLLDIPMDVQRSYLTPEDLALPDSATSLQPRAAPESAAIGEGLRILAEARRPLILAGGGIRASDTHQPFLDFVHRTGIPVVHSLMGVDLLAAGDPLRVGMIGSYGNRWANLALDHSDAVLVLGSRLDIRQTGADVAAWRARRSIIHVDCEPGEINNRVTGVLPILADMHAFFAAALAALPATRPDRCGWLAEVNGLRKRWPDTQELVASEAGAGGINPNILIHQIAARSGGAGAYVVDVGQHQMWAAQSLDLAEGQRFLTSGGLGAMGFALPAAIGAALSTTRPVVLIAGDGGFQVNIQELETVVRNRLAIKMIIFNNECHGMVRQFQQSFFEQRYASSWWGYTAPDFVAIARAYGISSRFVSTPGDAAEALDWLWQKPMEPALLEVAIPSLTNAYPKIAFGSPMSEMEPLPESAPVPPAR
ncbi:MAG: thiamine pyrophosphate-binding protein [Verrucomicrobiota bacterium]